MNISKTEFLITCHSWKMYPQGKNMSMFHDANYVHIDRNINYIKLYVNYNM